MNYNFLFKDLDNGTAFCAKDGPKLVTFIRSNRLDLCITFFNTEIDYKLPLNLRLHEEFGDVHSCYVCCDSESELLLCQTRLSRLVADGFCCEQRGIIGMDWSDIEGTFYDTSKGRYYHWECKTDEIIGSAEEIKKRVTSELGEHVKCIICFEGNLGLEECCKAFDIMDLSKNVFQLLFDEKSKMAIIDVWVFPQDITTIGRT